MLVPRVVFYLHAMTTAEFARYALEGMKLHRTEDGKPIAVVSDGRQIMAATWREDDPASFPLASGANPAGDVDAIVPASMCQKVCEMAKARGAPVSPAADRNVVVSECNKSDGGVSVASVHLMDKILLRTKAIAGRFPDYAHPDPADVPLNADLTTVSLGVDLLADMLGVFRKVGIKHVVLVVAGGESPTVLTGQTDDGVELAGLLASGPPDEPKVGWTPGWMSTDGPRK